MAINRSQLAKELEPGLNALFGMEYARYENEHSEIFETESSDRAFEEETMIVGFGNAKVKGEGNSVEFDSASESFHHNYNLWQIDCLTHQVELVLLTTTSMLLRIWEWSQKVIQLTIS